MKKGQSYNMVSDTTHPNHKLVKALMAKGYKDFELIYATRWSTDAGWSCNGYKLPTWLGYTNAEALKKINELEDYK